MPEPSNSAEIDKDKLWGWWHVGREWQGKLHKAAAYKALDIPEEMGDINAPKTMVSHNGISPASLVAIGALGLGAAYLFNMNKAADPVTPPAAVSPADSEYEIRFYDKDGNQITVPRKPTE